MNWLEEFPDMKDVSSFLRRRGGIYVISENNTPLYVGQSGDVVARLSHHAKDAFRCNDDRFSAHLFEVPDPNRANLYAMEHALIRHLSPPKNGKMYWRYADRVQDLEVLDFMRDGQCAPLRSGPKGIPLVD